MKKRNGIQPTIGFNCNDSETDTLKCNVPDSNRAHIYIDLKTGTHDVFELEVWGAGINEDGSEGKYFLVPNSTISKAVGLDIDLDLCTFEFIKIKLKTPEGGTSTIDILINTYWSPFRPS